MDRLLSFSEGTGEASILPSLAGMARQVNVCQRERSRMSTHGYAAADCQVDCQPFELALFSLDRGGRPQAAALLIWTVVDRPGQAGKSYESAARQPFQAVEG
jgi:hypothetical protein